MGCVFAADSVDMKYQYLQETIFAEALDEEYLRILAKFMEMIKFPPHSLVFSQGDPGDRFFIVTQGYVTISINVSQVYTLPSSPNDLPHDNSTHSNLIAKEVKSSKELDPDARSKQQFLCAKIPGEFLGEMAVVQSDWIRGANVTSGADGVEMLMLTRNNWLKCLQESAVIDAQKFRNTSKKQKGIVNVLETVLTVLGNQSTELQKCLRRVPFLKGCTQRKMQLFADLLIQRTYCTGSDIFRQGDVGRSMYILLKGACLVHGTDHSGRRTNLTSIDPSDYFGEIALMVNVPRTATVTATQTSVILELPLKNLSKFFEYVPSAKDRFHGVVKERVTRMFRKFRIPFFNSFNSDQFHRLSKYSVLEKYPSDHVIFFEGDIGDAFYIVMHGVVEIYMNNRKFRTQLRSGSYFGEIALVNDLPRTASAVAQEDCLLLRISKDKFLELFDDSLEAYALIGIKLLREKVDLKAIVHHPKAKKDFRIVLSKLGIKPYKLDFLVEATKFKRCKRASNMLEQGKKLYSRYLATRAKHNINVSRNLRQVVLTNLENGNVFPNLFSEVMEEVAAYMHTHELAFYKRSHSFQNLLEQIPAYEMNPNSEHREADIQTDLQRLMVQDIKEADSKSKHRKSSTFTFGSTTDSSKSFFDSKVSEHLHITTQYPPSAIIQQSNYSETGSKTQSRTQSRRQSVSYMYLNELSNAPSGDKLAAAAKHPPIVNISQTSIDLSDKPQSTIMNQKTPISPDPFSPHSVHSLMGSQTPACFQHAHASDTNETSCSLKMVKDSSSEIFAPSPNVPLRKVHEEVHLVSSSTNHSFTKSLRADNPSEHLSSIGISGDLTQGNSALFPVSSATLKANHDPSDILSIADQSRERALPFVNDDFDEPYEFKSNSNVSIDENEGGELSPNRNYPLKYLRKMVNGQFQPDTRRPSEPIGDIVKLGVKNPLLARYLNYPSNPVFSDGQSLAERCPSQ